MKKMILALMLLSMNCNYPQELIKLFQKDLTDRIKFESYPKQIVGKDLEMASKIHPELLYYYITYHNLKYDGKVEQIYRLYDKELGEARSKYIKERNGWFSLGEEQLKVMEKDSSQLSGELKYLLKNNPYKSLTIRQLCDSCFKTDRNRLNYIVYKYYMQDSDLMYLPNEDYATLKKEYEIKIQNKLQESLKNLNNLYTSFDNAEEDYSQLISFWYLFPDIKEKESIQARYTKLLFNNYYKDYAVSVKNKGTSSNEIINGQDRTDKNADIKVMFSYNYSIKTIDYNYSSNFAPEAKIDTKFDIAANQTFFGFGLSAKLSERDKMFSRLIIEGLFGVGLVEKTLFFTFPEAPPPYTGAKSEQFILAYKMAPEKNNLSVKRMLDFTLKVKTPILFIGHDLSLGVGGVADFSTLTYKTNMDFYFITYWRGMSYGYLLTYTGGYNRQLNNGEETILTLTKFYPILTAEYKLPWNFNLNCEVSLNFYTAGLSYIII